MHPPQIALNKRRIEELMRGIIYDGLYLFRHDGGWVLPKQPHKTAGTQGVVVVVNDKLRFQLFGFSDELLQFLAHSFIDFFGRLAFVHHAHALHIELPLAVFQLVALLHEAIEAFVERCAADAPPSVPNFNVQLAIFKHQGHLAFIAHEELHNDYGVYRTEETEAAMLHDAGVNIAAVPSALGVAQVYGLPIPIADS